ncbi:hypothetical protein ACOMHN_055571 [Nucella lapillus]
MLVLAEAGAGREGQPTTHHRRRPPRHSRRAPGHGSRPPHPRNKIHTHANHLKGSPHHFRLATHTADSVIPDVVDGNVDVIPSSLLTWSTSCGWLHGLSHRWQSPSGCAECALGLMNGKSSPRQANLLSSSSFSFHPTVLFIKPPPPTGGEEHAHNTDPHLKSSNTPFSASLFGQRSITASQHTLRPTPP